MTYVIHGLSKEINLKDIVLFNKVYHQEAGSLLKEMDDSCVDLIVTSPPYDNMRTYDGGKFDVNDVVNTDLYRVMKKGGVIVWVVGDQTINGSESGTSFRHALLFMEHGFKLHDTMIYLKPNFSMPSRNRYHQVFEYMFVFSKGRPKTFNPIIDRKNKYGVCWGTNTVRDKDGHMKIVKKNKPREYGMRHNVWKMNTAGQEKPCRSIEHPATFPEALARDHIISWSNEGDLVFDPLAGSGTTLIEAKKLNRNYIGCDKVLDYCYIMEEQGL